MQGRFKRDGNAPADPEHGGTGPMAANASPQHGRNHTQAPPADDERPAGAAHGEDPTPGKSAAKKSKDPTGHGSRIALRNWRISTRLVSLLALPVVAATSLGALRINESMENMQQLDNMKLLTEMTKQATELAAALQEERDQSAGPLAHGSSASAAIIEGDREKTDRARDNFLAGSDALDEAAQDGRLEGVRETVVGLARDLNGLNRIRTGAYESEGNSTQTVEAYHRLITNLLDLSQDMAEATSNPEMIQRTRALAAFSSAKEYASVQRAVIAAALPANNSTYGELSENDRLYAEAALQGQRSDIRSFTGIYGAGAEDLLQPITQGSPTIEAADQYASRALADDSGLESQEKRSYQDWIDESSTKIQQMANIESTLLQEMEQKARELRSVSEREAIISGALILIVLGVSLVGAFVVARSMIRSLRRLEDTATRVASDRLPELVKQLSESDPQDVDTSVESVGVHSRDEIGRVAAAFDDVHREAVRLAAEQALLRGNVNAMFTNLSRRSQGLIQRQLSLISELESREADPDQLSSLFKLDHLATRMRRNGENLLVLAGEEPGRRWTRPVPLVDVLRAAASEVEQYERIELSSVPTTQVAGRVVNDLVHLLAELLENATSFSSPQTKVKVTGHALPDGRVLIEIHDTGIGLSPEDLAAINERLASPPTVDVSVSRRMGLFVVGRLSQRHGIRIQLRPSDSGGTTALVMLPVDVAQGEKRPPARTGHPGSGGGPAAAQAAAGAAAARRAAGGGKAGPTLGPGRPGAGTLGAGRGPRPALPGSGGASGSAPDHRSPTVPAPPRDQRPPRPTSADNGLGRPLEAPESHPGAGPRTPQVPLVPDAFGGRDQAQGGDTAHAGGPDARRRPVGPAGPPAELPAGVPQPRVPDWGAEAARPTKPHVSPDAQRDHREPEDTHRPPRHRLDPAATAELPAVPEYGTPSDAGSTARHARHETDQPATGTTFGSTGSESAPEGPGAATGERESGDYVRSDVFGTPGHQSPSHSPERGDVRHEDAHGASAAAVDSRGPSSYDHAATGEFQAARPYDNGTHQGLGSPGGLADADLSEGLPPASGPGDGRTPLYDTLETNWFRGERRARPQGTDPAPAEPRAETPEEPSAPSGAPQTSSWRSSPNDDLVRQAERVRQPSAGGVTTSGLPRRVPRANLVPGTAEQQASGGGPQVSRAPDDVRGRLTNLRRGIAQGRQAGPQQTGTNPRPTHQQER
ncbi:nitrate- and nitrite sensing domain-containing protein [Streptomyces sp. WMMC905]|uniref:nitrate- and nitrite sensing domain-containing protein n=1 Tax=Streptomyces sp. WMMC905 TaxID=3404123 RepID=UPI003B93F3B0